MLQWFEARAPIRVKFRVLATTQGVLGLAMIALVAGLAADVFSVPPSVEIAL